MDATKRFSDRVDDYVKYRPSYPPELVVSLERDFEVRSDLPIADLGSGTGISTQLFLDRGYEVFAVEPNEAMRTAAVRILGSYGNRFHSIAGTAEATTLAAGSVGLVVAAQAFHWFDVLRAKAEISRISRSPKKVMLVWNERRTHGAFLQTYERILLEHGTDYARVRHQDAATPEKMAAFFSENGYREIVFPYEQRFDRDGLLGRALSSSYAPKAGHPNHAGMVRELSTLFDQHQRDGYVLFEYDTRAFIGYLE